MVGNENDARGQVGADDDGNIINLSSYPRPYVGNAASPFRYPGGKGFLTPFLAEEIRSRFGDTKPHYAEPYCGGAGAAVNLLVSGMVDQIFLNDADHRIFSSWKAMLSETDRFLSRLSDTSVDLSTWDISLRKLHEPPVSEYDFDTGFAAFFVNRTSRSGVLLGSGPIGGYDQTGQWKIDARFNKDGLSKRIQTLAKMRENIHLSCDDGLAFCKRLDATNVIDDTFLFVDPPYVGAGGRLYYNGMNEAKHQKLAGWLQRGIAPHWLLTYDDHPIVRENLKDFEVYRVKVQYSLGRRRQEKELLYKSVY